MKQFAGSKHQLLSRLNPLRRLHAESTVCLALQQLLVGYEACTTPGTVAAGGKLNRANRRSIL